MPHMTLLSRTFYCNSVKRWPLRALSRAFLYRFSFLSIFINSHRDYRHATPHYYVSRDYFQRRDIAPLHIFTPHFIYFFARLSTIYRRVIDLPPICILHLFAQWVNVFFFLPVSQWSRHYQESAFTAFILECVDTFSPRCHEDIELIWMLVAFNATIVLTEASSASRYCAFSYTIAAIIIPQYFADASYRSFYFHIHTQPLMLVDTSRIIFDI